MDLSIYPRSPELPRGFSFAEGEADGRLAIRPIGIVWGPSAEATVVAGFGRWLAGGPGAFTACEVTIPDHKHKTIAVAPLPRLLEWAEEGGPDLARQVGRTLEAISLPRSPFRGLSMDRARIMGVLNVTPDSFSDGGRQIEPFKAIAHGEALMAAGANIIDVGGESTRPGASPIPAEVEIERITPVVRALAAAGAVVSIDTRHAAVMTAALEAGACIVNDVTALEGDPQSLAVIAQSDASVVLMHMQGEPATMQDAPRYRHAPLDVYSYLAKRFEACEAAGIGRERIAVDPGIGFGKTVRHNLELLESVALFHGLGCVVMVGASRKSFIARLSREEATDDRLVGSLATAAWCAGQGVKLLRVHDVAETAQALAIREALELRC